MSVEININGKAFTTIELEAMVEKANKKITWPNGAEMEAPGERADYYYINRWGHVDSTFFTNTSFDLYQLANQNVFLSKEPAERYKDYQDTHNKILKRIIKLNAEQGWAEKWDSEHKNYSLLYKHEINHIEHSYRQYYQPSGVCMSEQTAKQIIKEFTQHELKKFLFIY